MDDFELNYQESRNLLGRFGLGGHAHEIPLRACSGGQNSSNGIISIAGTTYFSIG